MKEILVSVPATSANIGSGFDTAGLALNLYNTVRFSPAEKLEILTENDSLVPTDESNLVYQAAAFLYQKAGRPMPPMRIVQTNAIPVARGLGSSSACIVAGLLGANRMLGDLFSREALLQFATELEGHPDNVAPALLGGFVNSICADGTVYAVKRTLDPTLRFLAVILDQPLLTRAVREALPKEVPHSDAVFNVSRAALLQEAFCGGHRELLPLVTQDKLHQPYRMPLMPGAQRVFQAARQLGALAVFVSGAGSTIMVVMAAEKADAVCAELEQVLHQDEVCKNFVCRQLSGDAQGARVE